MDINIHLAIPKFVGFYQSTFLYFGLTFLGFGLGAIVRYPGWKRGIKELFIPYMQYYTSAVIGLLFAIEPVSVIYKTMMDPLASDFALISNLIAMYLLCGYSSACYDLMADAWLVEHGMADGYYIGKTWISNRPYKLSNLVSEIYLWPWNAAKAALALIVIIARNGKCPGQSD